MNANSSDGAELSGTDPLVRRLQSGDESALAEMFEEHRDRLWRMVQFRMDRRLAARVDPDDVLQEGYMAALARLDHYLAKPDGSLFIWFRLIVCQTLIDIHRRHLGAKMRSAGRDVSLDAARYPQATSVCLAAELLGSITSPSQQVARAEASDQLEQAIDCMSPLDQEIIALRHFEELSNRETAEVLGIQPTAASNRYVRAIGRLKELLDGFTIGGS